VHRCRHCPVPVVYDGRIRIVALDAVLARPGPTPADRSECNDKQKCNPALHGFLTLLSAGL